MSNPVIKKEGLARRVLKNPSGWASAGFVLVIILFGIFAPLLSQWDKTSQTYIRF